MSDTRLVQVRVPRAEAVSWRAAALREERSMAAFVRVAVREHLRTTQREEETTIEMAQAPSGRASALPGPPSCARPGARRAPSRDTSPTSPR
jgi:hypothetical protein